MRAAPTVAGAIIVLALGCYQSHRAVTGASPDAGSTSADERDATTPVPGSDAEPPRRGFDAGPPPPPPPPPPPDPERREVDLLLVVDNSSSMTEEQASLAAELPRLVRSLVTGDFDGDGSTTGPDDFPPVENLHAGVVTTDMGTGDSTVPTCREGAFGDDGVLRTTPGRPRPSGCMASYPPFLSFGATEPLDELVGDLECLSRVGTSGCGFEQPLEAALKAVSSSAPTTWTAPGFVPPVFYGDTFGHGDGANAGFLRDESILAVVIVTDEEDCSARDTRLYDPIDPMYGATDLNLRCFLHGERALHRVERYVEGLLGARPHPIRLVFSLIAGVPADLVPRGDAPIDWGPLVAEDPAIRDDRLEERIDSDGRSLVHSCDVPGRGVAFPPIRLLRTAFELQRRGAGVSVSSICQESFADPVLSIIRALR